MNKQFFSLLTVCIALSIATIYLFGDSGDDNMEWINAYLIPLYEQNSLQAIDSGETDLYKIISDDGIDITTKFCTDTQPMYTQGDIEGIHEYAIANKVNQILNTSITSEITPNPDGSMDKTYFATIQNLTFEIDDHVLYQNVEVAYKARCTLTYNPNTNEILSADGPYVEFYENVEGGGDFIMEYNSMKVRLSTDGSYVFQFADNPKIEVSDNSFDLGSIFVQIKATLDSANIESVKLSI